MAQVRRTHNSRGCGGDARMVGHRAVALAVCLCISLTCGCAWRVFGVKTSGESAGSAEVAEADAPVETDSSSERPGKTIDSGSGEVASAKLPIDLSRLAAGTVLTDAQIAEAGGEDAFFFVEPIDDELFARMQGVSFKDATSCATSACCTRTPTASRTWVRWCSTRASRTRASRSSASSTTRATPSRRCAWWRGTVAKTS